MKTVAIDFDGVLNHYSGWDGDDPKDDPLHGARDAVRELQKDFLVVIFTVRKPEYVKRWLERNGFPALRVTHEKHQKFTVMLDDRGLNFSGNWDTAVKQIKDFKPWWCPSRDPDE